MSRRGEKKKKKKKKEATSKKKKKRGGNVKKKSEKEKCTDKAHMQVHKGIFCSLSNSIFSFCFLSIFGRKHFCRSREKTLEPHHLFSFLLTQPNTFQKSFSSYFLFKFFYQLYFTSKQTHS